MYPFLGSMSMSMVTDFPGHGITRLALVLPDHGAGAHGGDDEQRRTRSSPRTTVLTAQKST